MDKLRNRYYSTTTHSSAHTVSNNSDNQTEDLDWIARERATTQNGRDFGAVNIALILLTLWIWWYVPIAQGMDATSEMPPLGLTTESPDQSLPTESNLHTQDWASLLTLQGIAVHLPINRCKCLPLIFPDTVVDKSDLCREQTTESDDSDLKRNLTESGFSDSFKAMMQRDAMMQSIKRRILRGASPDGLYSMSLEAEQVLKAMIVAVHNVTQKKLENIEVASERLETLMLQNHQIKEEILNINIIRTDQYEHS